MPTRRLPAHPNLEHLKHQAADLLVAHRHREPQALQRLREFHPRMRGLRDDAIAGSKLRLHDAYLAIAREYGFPSWPKLKAFVTHENAEILERPVHERIRDPLFRQAVDLLDAGDERALRELLDHHPELAKQRVPLYGGNYFQNPALVEFIAENPTRHGTLPPNIAQIARIILEAGAKEDRGAIDSALSLAASSRVAREQGVQQQLIDVLCDYGANPSSALLDPLMYGEFIAADALLRRGAKLNLMAAAALGREEIVRSSIAKAHSDDARLALALATQHERTGAVRALLDAGVDPNGYTPPPGHSHATALHQAALTGDKTIARMLLDRGANPDVRDVLYGGTPADWAEHAGKTAFADWLRTVTKRNAPDSELDRSISKGMDGAEGSARP